jgi:hypothetical protein
MLLRNIAFIAFAITLAGQGAFAVPPGTLEEVCGSQYQYYYTCENGYSLVGDRFSDSSTCVALASWTCNKDCKKYGTTTAEQGYCDTYCGQFNATTVSSDSAGTISNICTGAVCIKTTGCS